MRRREGVNALLRDAGGCFMASPRAMPMAIIFADAAR